MSHNQFDTSVATDGNPGELGDTWKRFPALVQCTLTDCPQTLHSNVITIPVPVLVTDAKLRAVRKLPESRVIQACGRFWTCLPMLRSLGCSNITEIDPVLLYSEALHGEIDP